MFEGGENSHPTWSSEASPRSTPVPRATRNNSVIGPILHQFEGIIWENKKHFWALGQKHGGNGENHMDHSEAIHGLPCLPGSQTPLGRHDASFWR